MHNRWKETWNNRILIYFPSIFSGYSREYIWRQIRNRPKCAFHVATEQVIKAEVLFRKHRLFKSRCQGQCMDQNTRLSPSSPQCFILHWFSDFIFYRTESGFSSRGTEKYSREFDIFCQSGASNMWRVTYPFLSPTLVPTTRAKMVGKPSHCSTPGLLYTHAFVFRDDQIGSTRMLATANLPGADLSSIMSPLSVVFSTYVKEGQLNLSGSSKVIFKREKNWGPIIIISVASKSFYVVENLQLIKGTLTDEYQSELPESHPPS